MPYLTLDGRRLFYADHQPHASGPALLLLHGAASSHLVWPSPLRRLPDTRVLALDLPGHGRSAPPGRRMVAHYASAVRQFIEGIGLNKVVIAGHSMGGGIALALALEPPPALLGIILIATTAHLRVNSALLSNCHAAFDSAADFIVEHGFAQAPDALRGKTRQAIIDAGAVTTFGDFLACQQFDARTRLAGVSLPALVISGSADRMTPPRHVDALVDGLPHARRIRIDGAGHFITLERPHEIAGHVIEFMKKVDSPRMNTATDTYG